MGSDSAARAASPMVAWHTLSSSTYAGGAEMSGGERRKATNMYLVPPTVGTLA